MMPSPYTPPMIVAASKVETATSGIGGEPGASDIPSRMQDQLLDAPVVHVGDVDGVFRRAGDAVRPVELPELVTGLAEHADDGAVEGQLVEPPGFDVRRIEILRRRRRDAQRPGGGFVGGARRQVAEHRMPRLVVRRVEQDDAKVAAVAIEDLNAVVAAIGDVDVVLPIDGNVVRRVELPRLAAPRAPRLDPVAVFIELGDARIRVAVADVDVVVAVPRNVGGTTEVAVDRRRRRPAASPTFEIFR